MIRSRIHGGGNDQANLASVLFPGALTETNPHIQNYVQITVCTQFHVACSITSMNMNMLCCGEPNVLYQGKPVYSVHKKSNLLVNEFDHNSQGRNSTKNNK